MLILPKGTESELLVHLLLNGPTIANRVPGIRNASRTARRLEKKGLITRNADKFDFSPQPAMLLSLTVDGIAIAFQIFFIKEGAVRILDKNTLKAVDKIASLWVDSLPNVFGKWSFFRKENLEYIATERLVYASYSVADRLESMRRAGHLWSPKRQGISPDEHMKTVFTRFFYDLIYDPTFNRVAYLAKWIRSLRDPDLDIRDSPLILWIQTLKTDTETQKHISDNFRTAQAEIMQLEILSSLIGDVSSEVSVLEEALVSLGKVFY